ncbi:hypothetical protein D030_1194 [Vibrio parahaemolyticus AQ3810]|nr:hypothetical protein D030_1194 [Vibrio parahaemolyticus AQ3810]
MTWTFVYCFGDGVASNHYQPMRLIYPETPKKAALIDRARRH